MTKKEFLSLAKTEGALTNPLSITVSILAKIRKNRLFEKRLCTMECLTIFISLSTCYFQLPELWHKKYNSLCTPYLGKKPTLGSQII